MFKALALGALLVAAFASQGVAGERPTKARVVQTVGSAVQTGARYHRHRPSQARYFAGRRIGFYSYSYRDVINTYGLSRTLYSGANTYNTPLTDRQTPSGPFDHGFFFDSGTGLHGGYSPYLH